MVPDAEHEDGAHATAGAPHAEGNEHLKLKERMTLLEDVFYEPRPLLQHVVDESLRGRDDAPERKAGYDELFFDLIIVAVIAVMGDDLRKHYTGWSEIWRFVLLYGTVISVWHDMTFLWNYVDTKRDFVEQITIILLIICLAGIGTRAEQAFRLTTRSLSFFAFFATLVGVIRLCLDTWLNNYDGKVLRNPRLVNALLTAVFALPYLVAAVLPDQENSKITPYLFLTAIILQFTRQLVFHHIYDWARRRWFPSVVMPTIHVDAMAERYALITLIVFGETFVSTLVEGQKTFNIRADTALFGATTCAICITFCLHSMYADVDNRLVVGDKQYVYEATEPDVGSTFWIGLARWLLTRFSVISGFYVSPFTNGLRVVPWAVVAFSGDCSWPCTFRSMSA